jgi:hypothetical protein
MATTIFFSWQLDRNGRAGKDLIQESLELATNQISADTTVEPAIRDITVDHDTKGVSGTPPIVETIFHKIDQAAVFVPDLTFVGKRVDGRPTPNPNVLIEYGWALNSLKHSRIVPVMNIAHGEPSAEAMPFDMRHLRNPTTYVCADNVGDDGRTKIVAALAEELEIQIRMVLDSESGRSSAYIEIPATAESPGRFVPASEPIGIDSDFRGHRVIYLAPGPVCWFRLMPSGSFARTFTVEDLETAIKVAPPLIPLNREARGWNYLRGADGSGLYSVNTDEPSRALSVVFAFTKGEVWSIDTVWLKARDDGRAFVPNVEHQYRKTLIEYGEFLLRLNIRPPYRWVAGMENLKGRLLYTPTPPGHMRVFPQTPDGQCLVETVTESGLYSPDDPTGKTLKPFFARLYNSCGVPREDWRDAI